MSYCRFSSDNWKSDVYVYDGSDGIIIHIASKRYEGYIPKLPNIQTKDYREARLKHYRALEKCQKVPISHPLAGKTIVCKSVKEAIDELTFLKYEKFHIPKFLISNLRTFIEE